MPGDRGRPARSRRRPASAPSKGPLSQRPHFSHAAVGNQGASVFESVSINQLTGHSIVDSPLDVTGDGEAAKEQRFEGIAVAPGIARGEAVIHWIEEEEIPSHHVPDEAIPKEIARFEAALIATRAELLEMQQRIAQAIGAEDASIFDAHLLVVEDRTLIDEVLRSVETEKINVEHAFHTVTSRYCKTLGEIDDPYLRERVVDIEDVSRRVIHHLMGRKGGGLHQMDRPQIIIAHNLTPSDTALINRSLVLGFATEAGSKTSHTAIMARSLDIPAIVGIHDICDRIPAGVQVLIDGYNGRLIVNPSETTIEEYSRYKHERELVEERLDLIRDTQSTTADGRHIILSANIELPEEMDDVTDSGAEGVGLYRTEFLFLNREGPPSEDEQYESYKLVAERSLPHSVIIRTLDIGGDKTALGIELPDEENPFLGCRAIRFCLENPDIFKPQLKAILRAATVGNVKLMYPMISGIGEFRRANQVLAECRGELQAAGIPFADSLDVGLMIEVPSAALSADLLANEAKFFSIGTNDLIQYAIAVDRVNERIAHLYEPTHPAILRLIKMTVDAAHARGIWVGVCGEMAGDIQVTPLLLGLGVDELSTGTGLVPRVKKAVQSLDSEVCKSLVNSALNGATSADILELCLAVARDRYGDLLG
jgi:phosphotransferase system enzyme I (PtsI)